MQSLGSAANTSRSPEVDMPVEEMIDVGTPSTTAAAASPVGDQAVAAAPEKVPYTPPAGGALGANMDHDTSAFEVNLGDGCSLEDLIASDVNEFFDAFRALDGPDGAGFADGINAADQGMEVDDDEFAWLNSPDAFMPLPIADADGLGEVAATATPTGKEEKEEEAEMAPGGGTEHVDEDVGRVLAGLVVSEATVETAPAAAAAVAATTTLPPVAVEGNTATSGIIGGKEAVSPHAPAYEFGAGGGAGGGALYLLAQGPADDAAVVGAVGVSHDTVETAPAAAAAVAATTTLPPVAVEVNTATSGIIGGQEAVSPHAPAYEFGAGGGAGGGAGYLLAQGPVDDAAVVGAVGVSQDTVETAPAAAAAVAATTLPPVALEDHTAETSGIIGGQDAVSPHAPAYDFGGGGTAGGAGHLFAEGPADGAAVVRAVGVEVGAAAPVTPTASSMTVNGDGGSGNSGAGGHDGGLSQKELIRRQKVERYLAKKTRRRWSRASSYQSRQRVANSRPRHKGRFLPLVSDFVPISELKRRQRALLAQRAAEEEGRKLPPPQPLPAPGWGTIAEFPAEGDYGQGEG